LETIVRGTERRDRGKTIEASDAMIGMDDKISNREAGRLGNEIDSPPCASAWPHQAIAEDVLLADNGKVRRLEALLDAQHGKADITGWQRFRLDVAVHLASVGETMLGEKRIEPL